MTITKTVIKKTLLILSLFAIIAIVISGLYVFYVTHSSSVNFQEYAPNYLPPGNTVTKRSVTIYSNNEGLSGLFSYTKQLNLNFNGDLSTGITEQNSNTINFSYTCNTYGAVNQTCTVEQTPNHQRYQLNIVYNPNDTTKPFQQDIEWLKGDTYTSITWEGSPVHLYSPTTLSKIIDSFTPAHYSGLSIIRSGSND